MTQPTGYTPFSSPITLDTLGDLFASKRDQFGGYLMEDPAPSTPPVGGDPASTPPSGEPAPAGGTPTPPPAPEKTFTQADLDAKIKERLAAESVKHQKALEQLQATAGKSELEAAQIKQKAAEDALKDANRSSGLKVATAEAKLNALTAGVRADRVDSVLRLADLSSVVADDGTVDEGALKAAVDAVIETYPEWKGEAVTPPPSSSGAPMGGAPTTPETFTREQLAKMSPAEYSAKRDEIMKAMAEGRVKG